MTPQVRCAAAVSSDIQAEREWLQRNKERKRRHEEAKHQLEVTQRKGDYETASCLHYAVIPELERDELECEIHPASHCEGAMLGERITSDDIARIVARPTGIPMQSLLKEEQERLVHVRASRSSCAFKSRNTCSRWLTYWQMEDVLRSCCQTGPRCTCGQRRSMHLQCHHRYMLRSWTSMVFFYATMHPSQSALPRHRGGCQWQTFMVFARDEVHHWGIHK